MQLSHVCLNRIDSRFERPDNISFVVRLTIGYPGVCMHAIWII